jgi:hypothetical protein
VNLTIGRTKVSADFPAEAHDSELTVTMQPVADPPPTGGLRRLGNPVSITAQDTSGNSVSSFKRGLTIVKEYTGADGAEETEKEWVVHYWRVPEQVWVPVPTLRRGQNVFEATVDHLTIFSLLEVEQQRIYLPFVVK